MILKSDSKFDTDFLLQKWHEEFGKFSHKHLKVRKF